MNRNYAKKKRQYQYLLKRINQFIESGQWQALAHETRLKLEQRLNRLYKTLSAVFSSKSLVKAMGAAALVLGFTVNANAQSFGPATTNPFSLTAGSAIGFPTLVDIDGDGDLDLFDLDVPYGGYVTNVAYRQNTGTNTNAVFGAQSLNPFGIQTDSLTISSTFADLDGDGDFDLMTSTYNGSHMYFKNTGTASNPQFAAPVVNPFGLSKATSYITASTFVDLDGDGDFDLMQGDYYGSFFYFENTGSATNPQFGTIQTNPFGLVNNSGYLRAPSFTDLDGDGDLDMMTCEYYGDFVYYQNTGSKTAPAFTTPQTNPFGLANVGSYPSFMCFADLDGDTDDDILVHKYYGDYVHYENKSGFGVGEDELTGISVYPNPSTSSLNIKMDINHSDVDVELIDMTGKAVYHQTTSGNSLEQTIDVSDFARGLYLVKVNSGGKSKTVRITLN